MKRIACLVLVVSIAYAGCADKKTDKVTAISIPPIWKSRDDYKSNGVLRLENARLKMEIDRVKKVSRAILAKWEGEQSKGKIMHKQNKTLLVRIAGLEAAMESQRVKIERSKNVYSLYEAAIKFQMIAEKTEKALLVRIAGLEAAIESQVAVIESLENVYRLYKDAVECQRAAIESLLKLCRLYEAEIESQRAAIENSKNIYGEFAGIYLKEGRL